jgi:serine/threonine protein kinase
MLLNNRYQVIRTLGSGGFGETFLAKDINMPSERFCVVKQLKPIQNNPQIYQLVQERFQREAAILEALSGASEQIPVLYAYFTDGGQFYLVQEWIKGDTLTAKIEKQGLFTNSAVEELLINILPVLDYVHSQHIIHRDIKPDNIILRYHDNKPVLIDFGAVRESMGTVVNSKGNPTSSIIIGTPGFMPSEQAAGRPVYSSDLYSLGLTAIYLLTGKYPQELDTDAQTAEIVWRHFASNINPNLAGVIDKAIAYHPRERVDSAREMLNTLQMQFVTLTPTSINQTKVASPLPETVTVSPGNNHQLINQNNNNSNNQGRMIIPSLIASGLISASIIIGSVINKSSQTVESANTKSQDNQKIKLPKNTSTQLPKDNTESNNQISANEPDQFYFIADSAYKDTQTANRQVNSLKSAGYPQAGMFWIPDYPNLSGKILYEVYANQFSDKTSCINFLKTYGTVNKDAYCARASKNANISPERVSFQNISNSSTSDQSQLNTTNTNSNNYLWLSERQVTETDLAGKSGYELDIMRNTIFAIHGRKFTTPGVQDYFNQQSWYKPEYSPDQFPMSLLSRLEIENAEYINQYQERYNLRHFKK